MRSQTQLNLKGRQVESTKQDGKNNKSKASVTTMNVDGLNAQV